jgi:hypothetical protein
MPYQRQRWGRVMSALDPRLTFECWSIALRKSSAVGSVLNCLTEMLAKIRNPFRTLAGFEYNPGSAIA